MEPPLAEVHFPIPLRRGFDYRVPPGLDEALQPGRRVWAPFGKFGRRMGLIARRHAPDTDTLPLERLKFLEGAVEADPVIAPKDFPLVDWMARRYFCSWGEAAFTVAAVGTRRPPRRPAAAPAPTLAERPHPFSPSVDQQAALDHILPAVRVGGFRPFLVRGVAAAGKTEVYRRAIEAALEQGKGAILLVPEIGLTPQMENIFRRWFGAALEMWHSDIADGERWRVWRRARTGECRLVVGPRSALFVPITPLGLIILDEEHDPSYKQDSAPHYHARDTALEKARLWDVPVLFGSATPSLESARRAEEGVLTPLVLSRRIDDRPFPSLHVVDMRTAGWYLSDELVLALRRRLDTGEQSLLFLNRRGYATRVVCRGCAWEGRCPHCEVSLVLHKESAGDILRCHTCEHHQPAPTLCPLCRQETMKTTGRGTQRVLRDLATLFPQARILRWDRDTMARRGAHAEAFDAVHAGEVDIIVGTQMVTQGHDFPRLTLVGVVDADSALRFPDFRAAERTFQKISQVAGRAGRADRPGEVYIQTRYPDHYALRAITGWDYDAFLQEELAFRREAAYPPFTRLAQILLRAREETRAVQAAEDLMRHFENPLLEGVTAMGPAPALHAKREGWSQWQVVLKSPPDLFPAALDRLAAFSPVSGVTLSVNVDPEDLE